MSIGVLDKHLPAPLYHQLQCLLKAEIESGKWPPDGQLPTELELAKRFGISKITVRQALQALAGLGYIRRQQGRGTFVVWRKFDEGPRELTGFTEEMKRHHLTAGSRMLGQAVVEANTGVAAALRLAPRELVFVLRRLRLANGEPMGIQTAHIPAALAPGLWKTGVEKTSLYAILQGRYGLYPARAREAYFAASAGREEAELLGIAAGAPVFAVERVTMLPNEKPFEFVQSVMRGDRYNIVLDLVKDSGENAALTLTG
jgi:GntR family transcriptional regulator, N-acetylglucosamine utilization regulator